MAQLISQLQSTDGETADQAYQGLFCSGTAAIDALLALGESAATYAGGAYANPSSSLISGEMPRLAQVALNLVDGIRVGNAVPHLSLRLYSSRYSTLPRCCEPRSSATPRGGPQTATSHSPIWRLGFCPGRNISERPSGSAIIGHCGVALVVSAVDNAQRARDGIVQGRLTVALQLARVVRADHLDSTADLTYQVS